MLQRNNLFLQTDNLIGGRYYAELVKEVIADLEERCVSFCYGADILLK